MEELQIVLMIIQLILYKFQSKKQKKKKEGFPSYAITIIIVISLGVILAGAFLIYKFLLKKKDTSENSKGNEIQNKINPYMKELNQNSTNRNIKNSVKIINYEGVN